MWLPAALLVHVKIFTVPFSKTRVSKSRAGATIYSCPLYTCYTTCALCRANGEDMERRWTHERVAPHPDSYSLRGSKPRKMDCYGEPRESLNFHADEILNIFTYTRALPVRCQSNPPGCRWRPMNNKRVSARNDVAVNR